LEKISKNPFFVLLGYKNDISVTLLGGEGELSSVKEWKKSSFHFK